MVVWQDCVVAWQGQGEPLCAERLAAVIRRLFRNILANKPRVTKFPVQFDDPPEGTEGTAMLEGEQQPEQYDVLGTGDDDDGPEDEEEEEEEEEEDGDDDMVDAMSQ